MKSIIKVGPFVAGVVYQGARPGTGIRDPSQEGLLESTKS